MFASAAHRVLDLVRARRGAPTVQFTPDAVRGGNILYYWQWAHIGRSAGRDRSVLRTHHMDPWLKEFPVLEELTVSRSKVGFFDKRAFATRHHFGTSFTGDQNASFSRWLIDQSPSFASRIEAAQAFITDETCVINVRRGDYYSVSNLREEFGIDIRSHVIDAVGYLDAVGRHPADVLIVSDDPAWCRDNLTGVLPGEPRFLPERTGMFDDFAALAAARTLVLANSTFSYWGSFFATFLRTDHIAVAPPFHQRVSDGSTVDDLFDPRWKRTVSRGEQDRRP